MDTPRTIHSNFDIPNVASDSDYQRGSFAVEANSAGFTNAAAKAILSTDVDKRKRAIRYSSNDQPSPAQELMHMQKQNVMQMQNRPSESQFKRQDNRFASVLDDLDKNDSDSSGQTGRMKVAKDDLQSNSSVSEEPIKYIKPVPRRTNDHN